MNRILKALPLIVAAGWCQAGIVGVAELQGGASILLKEEHGPCVGGARLASFVKADGDAIPGCWVSRGHHIAVVFFDGDIGAVPVAALKPPKQA